MIEIRRLSDDDRPWAVAVETESWGEPVVARLGELVDPTRLPGFVALLDGQRAGLASYAVRGDACEVVTITSLREGTASPARCSRPSGTRRSRPAADASGS